MLEVGVEFFLEPSDCAGPSKEELNPKKQRTTRASLTTIDLDWEMALGLDRA